MDRAASDLFGVERSSYGAAEMPSQPHLVRQLKLFAWSLLLINLFIVAVAPIAARHLDDPTDAFLLFAIVAVLVDGSFLLIVGGNLLVIGAISLWRAWRRRSPGGSQ